MKQIGIRLDEETVDQIRALAELWGLPEQRHNTAVIARCVERVYMREFEQGKTEVEKQNASTIDNEGGKGLS